MADGDPPEDAFSVLANETRLAVIRAIGEASGDGTYATLSYGTLQEAAGAHDSGNLNYHLRELRGRFVERVEDGYRLTVPGIRVYQAVLSGSFTAEHHAVPPTPTGERCVRCSGPMEVRYENARYYLECGECGWLHTRYPLPPNAFDPADPESLSLAGRRQVQSALRTFISGICPYCSGSIATELTTEGSPAELEDHERAFAHLECTNCHWYHHPPVQTVTLHHPATRVFYERRGVPTDPYPGIFDGDIETAVESRDPWRVAVTHRCRGDALRLVVEDSLAVTEWERVDDGTPEAEP